MDKRRCKQSRITSEMYAAIPTLLAQGLSPAEIAGRYGVTPGTLRVLCSERNISLRYPRQTKAPAASFVLPDRLIPLSGETMSSLRQAASRFKYDSTTVLVKNMLEKIAAADLYRAILEGKQA